MVILRTLHHSIFLMSRREGLFSGPPGAVKGALFAFIEDS
jgi:hypothetical protein